MEHSVLALLRMLIVPQDIAKLGVIDWHRKRLSSSSRSAVLGIRGPARGFAIENYGLKLSCHMRANWCELPC